MAGRREQTKALVVGGTGFLGRGLCKNLLENGWRVSSLTRHRVSAEDAILGVSYLHGLDDSALVHAFSDVDVVFNLANAGIPAKSHDNMRQDVDQTVGLNISLLQACVRFGVKKYIFTSSGGTVYGQANSLPIKEDHPTNPLVAYGVNKLSCEKYIALFERIYGLKYTILRVGNPYGPGQSPLQGQGVVAKYIYDSLAGKEFTVYGDGSAVRDYLFISDVSEALRLSYSYDGPHRVFNIGSGFGTTLLDIFSLLKKHCGIEARVNFTSGRNVDVGRNILDISLLKQEFQWEPAISMENGLKQTVEWVNQKFFR